MAKLGFAIIFLGKGSSRVIYLAEFISLSGKNYLENAKLHFKKKVCKNTEPKFKTSRFFLE